VKKLRVITWPLRVGIVAAVAATVLVSASGWRATHFGEIPRMSAPPTETRAAQLGSYRPALLSELDRAVDGDPFHPERRRPQVRYELPGSAPEELPQASAPPAEQIELIGTVVAAGGRSFAMCQTSAGPQIVHIGEKFVGFTLKSVEQGTAVFVSPQGKVMNVHVKKAGS
jgi:hypothetical protein